MPLSEALQAAVWPSSGSPAGAETPGSRALWTLLQRACGKQGVAGSSISWEGVDRDDLGWFALEGPWRVLHTDERKTLLGLLGMSISADRVQGERGPLAEVESTDAASDQGSRKAVRTVDRVLPAMVDDVLHVRGCHTREGEYAAARMTWLPDGRPRSLQMADLGLQEKCQRASLVLLASSLSPLGMQSDSRDAEYVALPLNKTFIESLAQRGPCMPRTARRDPRAEHSAGSIKAPKKTRDKQPRYPEGAQRARVEGAVLLGARVDGCGCVEYIRVERSPGAGLGWAGLNAVSAWRYTPTLLDGKPVRVLMDVTVNFKLR